MKMTLKEARDRYLGLSGTAELVLPAKLSFAITCNLEKLEAENKRIDKEREKFCKQYAEKEEDGSAKMKDAVINNTAQKVYDITDENRKLLEKEMEALLEEETDIEIRTVKQELLEQCEKNDRYSVPSVANIYAMSFMITE